MKMIERNKKSNGYLDRKPKIRGVNMFPNFEFLEIIRGKYDAGSNQICECNGGYITPRVVGLANYFDSYVDQAYLFTSQKLEPVVREANSLVIELNLLLGKKEQELSGTGEEAQRKAAAAASSAARDEGRKKEILGKLSDIRVQSDMVNESLMHHIEQSEGILHARVSKYWRGILSASTGEFGHFPQMVHRECAGRAAYAENREKLVAMIERAIKAGGGIYEE